MAKRSGDRRKARPPTNRQFPRTARLNTLLQEIIAGYLERVEDDRLGFLTVTGVEVDSDLNRAMVYVSTLADESYDDELLEALGEYRKAAQGEVARSARIRKTPEVVFQLDPAVRTGARIENILASLDNPGSETSDDDESPIEDEH